MKLKQVTASTALMFIVLLGILLTGYAWSAWHDGTWEPMAAWVGFWLAVLVFAVATQEDE